MKINFFVLLLFIFIISKIYADNKNTGDQRTVILKTENGWSKTDYETPPISSIQTVSEGISYSANSDGIFIILPKASNNVKLLAMTGEVVWSGNLVQGRFFIPTRQGIYFLKVNNKSYKIICK